MSEMDVHEQQLTADGASQSSPGGSGAPSVGRVGGTLDAEAPVADALEQQADVVDAADEPASPVPDDVDPADRAEQARAVSLDEDDYR